MTNTITLSNAEHGTFTVDADHLAMVMVTRFNRVDSLVLAEVHALVGEEVNPFTQEGTYSDLTKLEALVVISYLTGGARA